MNVYIQLTDAGSDIDNVSLSYYVPPGPYLQFATGVSKTILLAGSVYDVPYGSTYIKITSTGRCTNEIIIPIIIHQCITPHLIHTFGIVGYGYPGTDPIIYTDASLEDALAGQIVICENAITTGFRLAESDIFVDYLAQGGRLFLSTEGQDCTLYDFTGYMLNDDSLTSRCYTKVLHIIHGVIVEVIPITIPFICGPFGIMVWTYSNIDGMQIPFTGSYAEALTAQNIYFAGGSGLGGKYRKSTNDPVIIGGTLSAEKPSEQHCNPCTTGYYLIEIHSINDPIYHVVDGYVTEKIYRS